VALREDALGVTRRWRWFGTVEVGYEREREFDGGISRGPSVSLGLPLFNQGQGALERAQAELLQARADLDAQVLAVHNAAHLGIEKLKVSATIAERYRTELVPRREAIVARTQERVNFMLVGVFELLLAKQQEYHAYQAYLEAVRDYWTARAELRSAVGGRLPDDDQPLPPTIGVEAILPAASASPMDHGAHGMPSESEADPHAGHRIPEATSPRDADPHAGHGTTKPQSAPDSDPHTGHSADATEAVDPHAGHRQTAPERDPPATPQTDESADAHSDHDHGDRP
jgi:cobalt-zinc-cadmium efflux system outer membrane protein